MGASPGGFHGVGFKAKGLELQLWVEALTLVLRVYGLGYTLGSGSVSKAFPNNMGICLRNLCALM